MNTPLSESDDSLLTRLTPFLVIAWLLLFWSLFFTSTLPNASNAERTVDRLDIIGLLPEIYESLISPEPDPKNSSSWSNLSERIDVLGIALFIGAAASALGRLSLRAIGLLSSLNRTESLPLAGGIGLSLLSLWTLATGKLGLLSALLYWAMMTALVVAELWFSRKGILTLKTGELSERKGKNSVDGVPIWLGWGIRLICLAFFSCMLLGAMLPQTDFDVKEYHLGGPKEYFLAGRIQFLPHDVYTSFPFLTEMISLTGMVLKNDWERGAYVGQTVLMFFAPLTTLAVFCSAKRLCGATAGWLAALAYATIPWTYRISIIAYTEGALCCYVVLPLLAFQIWQERTHALPANDSGSASSPFLWRHLLLLGFLSGSAVSTKYPGMILVAIPFSLAVITVTLRQGGKSLPLALKNLVIYGVGVLLAFGPWMLKNLIETGNPVYPLLYGVFGGVDWNETLHRKWQAGHPPKLFSGTWDDFAGVFYKNDWQSPLLFGMAPLAFLGRNRKGVAAVWGYALVLLAAWALLTHRIDRFWVPMNSIMAVLAGCGLAAILFPFAETSTATQKTSAQSRAKKLPDGPPPSPIQLLLRLISAGLVVGTLIYNFGFITTPLGGYNAYHTSYAVANEQAKTPSVKIVEELKLPPGSKVLFVGEAALFDAHFPYAYNTVFDKDLLELWSADEVAPGEWKLKPLSEIQRKLREEKITHVFINWNELLRYRTTYRYTDFIHPERIQQLVTAGLLKPVSMPDWMSYRSWDGVDNSWKQEIERWAPELHQHVRNEDVMLQFQCFEVVDYEAASD